jgi:hypothetical protein
MALAITTVDTFKDSGQEFHAVLTLGASGTYTTGGETLSFLNGKIKTQSKPTFGMGYTTAGWLAVYDTANDKVMLWNGTTQFSSGGNLSGITVYMTFWFPKV